MPVDEKEQAMSRILVGIDDSPGAREALAWAAREAQATGAALSVIHAWHFDIAWIDAVNPDVPKWRDRARDTGERLVRRVVLEVCGAQPDSNVECCAIEGGAADVLLDAAADADLLVVGSRGRGTFAGALLGSVSNRVAHCAPCPVVIVPPTARASEDRGDLGDVRHAS